MSYNHNNLGLLDPFSTIDSIFNSAFAALESPYFPTEPVVIPNKANSSICSGTFPAADLYAEEDGYHIEVAAAGYTEDDITPEYKDDYLHLIFKKPKTEVSKKRIWVQHRIKLPDEAELKLFIDTRKYDVSEINITMENGMLKIFVPNSKSYVASYRIGINGKAPKAVVDETPSYEVEKSEESESSDNGEVNE